jgi:hypothetical protein
MTVLVTGAPGTAGRSRAAGRPDRSVREHIDLTLQAKRPFPSRAPEPQRRLYASAGPMTALVAAGLVRDPAGISPCGLRALA